MEQLLSFRVKQAEGGQHQGKRILRRRAWDLWAWQERGKAACTACPGAYLNFNLLRDTGASSGRREARLISRVKELC